MTRKAFLLLCSILTLFSLQDLNAQTRNAQLFIDASREEVQINKNIYGHFAEHLGGCIYGGIWVGPESNIPNTRGIRNDVVSALRKLNVPVLRWPGGCFADTYHWRDGIGPREQRPNRINTFWGDVIESNHFGTHEFMDLIGQLGTEAYFAGNVGSGSPQEMHDWVEYLTYPGESTLANLRRENGQNQPWDIPFWGVGNENWGCGGNMPAEFYAYLYRQFATYVMDYGENDIYKIAGGAGGDNYHWTETLMREAGNHMDGLSLHYYTLPGNWSNKGPALGFDEAAWFTTLRKALDIDRILARHIAIMDQFDPRRRVGLMIDEWGTWYDPMEGTNPAFLKQQNSLRDALVAGVTLNIFHDHAERVRMANIAQTVNVLQAMIHTDGPEMFVTPTYHVFEMYKVHQDAMRLASHLDSPEYQHGSSSISAVNVSASKNNDGVIHVSLCNLNPNTAVNIEAEVRGKSSKRLSGRVLTANAMDAHNNFENKNRIAPADFNELKSTRDGFTATLPPKSVVVIEIR